MCSPTNIEKVTNDQITVILPHWPSKKEVIKIDEEARRVGWEGVYLWQRNGIVFMAVVMYAGWDVPEDKAKEMEGNLVKRLSTPI